MKILSIIICIAGLALFWDVSQAFATHNQWCGPFCGLPLCPIGQELCGDGIGNWCDPAPACPAAPPMITSFTAFPSSPVPGTSVTLTATASVDVGPTNYFIRIKEGATLLTSCSASTTCSTSVTSAVAATKTYTADIWSSGTGTVSSMNLPVTWALPAPTILSPWNGATVPNTTPTLDWNDITSAVAYYVNLNDPTWNQIVTTSSVTIPSGILTAGETSRWRVRACTEANCATFHPWSNGGVYWSFTVAAAGDTTPPAFIDPTCVESDCSPSYSTPDTKPLFVATTDENAFCKYSLVDNPYDSMVFNCEAGEGTTSHNCNGDSGSFSFLVGPQTVFISCKDTAPTPNKNTSANNLNLPFTVAVAGLPDFDITNVSILPAAPAAGQTITFGVNVKNIGTAPSSGGILRGIGGPNPLSVPGCGTAGFNQISIPAIAVGGTQGFSMTKSGGFSPAGVYDVYMFADVNCTVMEVDNTNNQFLSTISVGGGSNIVPTANAGPDQTVVLPPGEANLNGTATDPVGDGDGDGPLTIIWSKISGPGTATFANPNAEDTLVTFSAAGTHVLELFASDGTLSATDTATITVTAAAAVGSFSVGTISPTSATEGVAKTFQATITVDNSATKVSSCTFNVDGAVVGTMVNAATGSPFATPGSECNPNSTCTAQVSHTFPLGSAGPHPAFARCANDVEAKNGTSATIIVTTAGPPTCVPACTPPDICISAVCTPPTPPGGCNNNNIWEGVEQCDDTNNDGIDLAGQTCTTLGFSGGTLKCKSCNFDTSRCTVTIKFKNPLGTLTFTGLINNIINFLFTIAVIIAPILLVIAGVIFMTAAGDPGKVKTARTMLLWTIVGFGIILISKGLVSVLKGILNM